MTRTPAPTTPRIFFGHHKAATSWIIKILSDICYLNGFRMATANTGAEINDKMQADLGAARVQFLAFRNADPSYLPLLSPFIGFHVIRDPRDIIVSSYFSHLKTHPTANWPELAAHQAHLRTLNKHDGILADMEFCRELTTKGFSVRPFESLRTWDYNRPDILELRYEELVSSPYESFLDIFRFLAVSAEDDIGLRSSLRHMLTMVVRRAVPFSLYPKWDIPHWNTLSAVFENRFQRKSAGRERGTEDQSSHYRKGVAGDWRNHLSSQHLGRICELYGPVCAELGYE